MIPLRPDEASFRDGEDYGWPDTPTAPRDPPLIRAALNGAAIAGMVALGVIALPLLLLTDKVNEQPRA